MKKHNQGHWKNSRELTPKGQGTQSPRSIKLATVSSKQVALNVFEAMTSIVTDWCYC